MGTIFIICASILWCVLHSILASHTVKGFLRRATGAPAFDRSYRLSYNFFALSSLYPLAVMLYTFPDRLLYSIPFPWLYLTAILQGFAIILLISAVVQTGTAEFLGLEQLSEVGEMKAPVLITDGWYAYVRHPLYVGILLLAWPIPEMTLNRLALLVIFSLYLLIGAWFEERNLLKDFDPAYTEYKARVPMFIPKIAKLIKR